MSFFLSKKIAELDASVQNSAPVPVFGTEVETANANLPLSIAPGTVIGGVTYDGADSKFLVEIRYIINGSTTGLIQFIREGELVERTLYENTEIAAVPITRIFPVAAMPLT